MSIKNFVIDIGCGEGGWLRDNGGPGVVGLDSDLMKLHKARLNAKAGTNFILADAQFLPFKENSFAKVRASGVLHHVENFLLAIDEMHRVLNGSLEIIEVVDNNPFFRVLRRIIRSWKGMAIKSFFRSRDLEEKIESASFTIVKTDLWAVLLVEVGLGYLGVYADPPPSFMSKIYTSLLRRLKLLESMAIYITIEARTSKITGNRGS